MSEVITHLTAMSDDCYDYIYSVLAAVADSCSYTPYGISAVFSGGGDSRALVVAELNDPVFTVASVDGCKLKLMGDEEAMKAVNHGTAVTSDVTTAVIIGNSSDGQIDARLISGEASVGDTLSPEPLFTIGYTDIGTVSGALEAGRAAVSAVLAFAEELKAAGTVEVIIASDPSRIGLDAGRADFAVCVSAVEGNAGDGAMLRVKDRRFSPDAPLRHAVESAAAEAGLKLTPVACKDVGLGAAVQRCGIPTAEVDIPTEHLGSPWELCAIDDIALVKDILLSTVK